MKQISVDEGVCIECEDAGPVAVFEHYEARVVVCAVCLEKALDELTGD